MVSISLQASIRVLELNGSSGSSLGEWLIDQGLDAPKSRTSRSSEEEHKRPRKKSPLEPDRRRPVSLLGKLTNFYSIGSLLETFYVGDIQLPFTNELIMWIISSEAGILVTIYMLCV